MTAKYEIMHPANPTVLCIIPELAAEIGLNESLVLNQIAFWIKQGNNLRDGDWWTYQSLRDMQKKAFKFLAVNTINRAIKNLEKAGLIKVTDEYNARKADKTRWFALIPDAIQKLKSVEIRPITQEDKAVPKRNSKKAEKPKPSNNEADKAVPERNRLSQNGTTLPETTQRKDKKTKDSPVANAPGVTPAPIDKPKPAKPRDRLFDAIAFAWKTNGSFTGKLKNFLTGKMSSDAGKWHTHQIDAAEAMTAPEVVGFYIWCRVNKYLTDKGLPTKTPLDLHDRIDDFRGVPNLQMYLDAGQSKLDAEISPLPVEEGDPADGMPDIEPETIAERGKILEAFLSGNQAVNQ